MFFVLPPERRKLNKIGHTFMAGVKCRGLAFMTVAHLKCLYTGPYFMGSKHDKLEVHALLLMCAVEVTVVE